MRHSVWSHTFDCCSPSCRRRRSRKFRKNSEEKNELIHQYSGYAVCKGFDSNKFHYFTHLFNSRASFAIWHMRNHIWYRFSYREFGPIWATRNTKHSFAENVFCFPHRSSERESQQRRHARIQGENMLFYVLRHVSMLTRRIYVRFSEWHMTETAYSLGAAMPLSLSLFLCIRIRTE